MSDSYFVPDLEEEMLDGLRFHYNGGIPAFVPVNAQPGKRRIALVGLSQCGKKTLYNSLWGWEVLSRETPREQIHNLGSFSIAELPDVPENADAVLLQLEGYDVVVYLLDAQHGLRSEDFQWIARLRALNSPLMVVLNKDNLIVAEKVPLALGDLQKKLGMPILALNAEEPQSVHEVFLPALLKFCPTLGTTLASEIISLRRHVVNHFIRESVMASASLNLEELPDEEISALVEIQADLVKQIARVYGHPLSNSRQHDVTLIAFFSSLIKQFTQQFNNALAGLGWVTSRFVAAFSTWVIGQFAALYYGSEVFPWKRNEKGRAG